MKELIEEREKKIADLLDLVEANPEGDYMDAILDLLSIETDIFKIRHEKRNER